IPRQTERPRPQIASWPVQRSRSSTCPTPGGLAPPSLERESTMQEASHQRHRPTAAGGMPDVDSPGGTVRRRLYALFLTSPLTRLMPVAASAVVALMAHVPSANAAPAEAPVGAPAAVSNARLQYQVLNGLPTVGGRR